MPELKTIRRRASTINMLPSVGKPDLDAAAKLMVPVILEALHAIDNEKKAPETSLTADHEQSEEISITD